MSYFIVYGTVYEILNNILYHRYGLDGEGLIVSIVSSSA
jgi:hypothetical protein